MYIYCNREIHKESEKEMKKIILFEPGIGTDNLGDQVIVEGVKTAISPLLQDAFTIEFSTHTPLYNRHVKHCENADFKFVCGSNLLVGNLGVPIRFRQWPINLWTSSSLKPCILVGVGAQKYGQKIGPYTKAVYRRILDSNYMHSVRDSFTEEQLKAAGFNNVLNTGCPTMWGLTEEVCRQIPEMKSKKVIFTLTDYSQDKTRDTELIKILKEQYDELWFWPQGSRDLDYLKTLDCHNIKLIGPSLSAYDTFLETEKADYVGTRLHGGMRALQHKRRTIILGIDNRAIELHRDYNIPMVKQENLKSLGDIISNTWKTKIKLPVDSIKKFLKQFGIDYSA